MDLHSWQCSSPRSSSVLKSGTKRKVRFKSWGWPRWRHKQTARWMWITLRATWHQLLTTVSTRKCSQKTLEVAELTVHSMHSLPCDSLETSKIFLPSYLPSFLLSILPSCLFSFPPPFLPSLRLSMLFFCSCPSISFIFLSELFDIPCSNGFWGCHIC